MKVKAADFANRFGLLFGLIFFILCSCLASLFSGTIIFRDRPISKIKFTLFGLWNFLTLVGFSIAAYISKLDIKFAQLKESQQSDIYLRRILTRTLLVSLGVTILLILLSLFFVPFGHWQSESLIMISITYMVTTAFLAPFVWGYYKNRKIMKFIILFTVSFILISIIFQMFLKLII